MYRMKMARNLALAGLLAACAAARAVPDAAPLPAEEIPIVQPICFPGLDVLQHANQRQLTQPAAGLFVAPDGKPDGKGTKDAPLDLKTVLSGKGPVKPGDVVWLMPGTYSGNYQSDLAGTEESPILVRGWPGKRVHIDGQLIVRGAHTWYWGFEVYPVEVNHRKAPEGESGAVSFTNGFHCRLINLIVHNAATSGIGYHNNGKDERSEVYGCQIYDTGWQPGSLSHGFYVQNLHGQKFICDNISFNSWAYCLQVYASGSWVNGVRIEGNFLFNPSVAAYECIQKAPLTFGGADHPAKGMTVIRQNYTCYNENPGYGAVFDMRLGYKKLNDTLVCTDNFMAGGYGFEVGGWRSKLMERNTFYLRGKTPNAPGGKDDKVYDLATERPKSPMFVFRPNKYEAGRGNLAIYNFPGMDAVSVDLSNLKGLPVQGDKTPTAFLAKGDSHEVRSVFRYYGAPVAAGVCDGGPITIDMKPLPDVAVGGNGRPLVQARPGFDAFVVLKGAWRLTGAE